MFEAAEVAAAPVYDAAAAARRRASAGPRAPSSQVDDPDLGTHDGPGAGGVAERDPGRGRPPRAGRSGRTTTPSTAACSASTPSASTRCGPPAPSEPTSEGAPCAHHEPDVPSWPRRRAASACARRRPSSGRRPRVPRPRGRLRAVGQGGGPVDRGRRADRAGLGTDRAGRAGQRHRHALVPRRHHRDRHRGTGRRRRADRAQGAARPRRLVGRRAARPSSRRSSASPGRSASRSSSRRPRGWPTRSRSPRRASGSRR